MSSNTLKTDLEHPLHTYEVAMDEAVDGQVMDRLARMADDASSVFDRNWFRRTETILRRLETDCATVRLILANAEFRKLIRGSYEY